jgi:hypothetical protein
MLMYAVVFPDIKGSFVMSIAGVMVMVPVPKRLLTPKEVQACVSATSDISGHLLTILVL